MISAKVIQDSISESGIRITTMELVYPRFIHCFDDETEVLVKIGNNKPQFKKFSEVIGVSDCKVAQVNTNSDAFDIDFVKPSAWHEQDYVNEKMVSLESHQRLNFVVTKGHRMFVGSRKKDYDKKEFILAEEFLRDYTQKRFYKSGMLVDKNNYGNNFCKFLAYFVSDGTLPVKGKQAIFRFKKARKIQEVKRLLDSMVYPYEERKYSDGSTNLVLQRQSWMEDCYNDFGEKCVPARYFNMSESNFESFKQGLLESDGCTANNEFNSFSEELINDLSVIFHTHGEAFNIRKYGECFKVKFLTEDTPILRKDKHEVKEIDYTGKVYCVTVPTGAILVRRKGVVHISGNCEFMTHRAFSRNAASSRAIPIEKMIETIENNPAMPVHWGKNQAGMQAKEELDAQQLWQAQQIWLAAAKDAIAHSRNMSNLGVHKQIANRITEPFQWMKVVVTATDWNNFFWLRDHLDAQPEIAVLAKKMKEAMDTSEPFLLYEGEWHVPYVERIRETVSADLLYCVTKPDLEDPFCYERTYFSVDEAKMISASCCAQVSYRKNDDSLEKAKLVFDRLINSEPVHASPVEHQATPLVVKTRSYYTWGNTKDYETLYPDGATHTALAKFKVYSNNFQGWIQYRALIPNNVKQ